MYVVCTTYLLRHILHPIVIVYCFVFITGSFSGKIFMYMSGNIAESIETHVYASTRHGVTCVYTLC